MPLDRVFAMKVSSVYPLYVQKAERKQRSKAEVDRIIRWLTGYTPAGLARQLTRGVDFRTFFAEAPRLHPNVGLITGVVCGVRVEDVADPLMQKIRYLDKLVDELAKGRPMEKILRDGAAPTRARPSALPAETRAYVAALPPGERAIAKHLATQIARALPDAEHKLWHRHPVWFLDGNPIVGFSKLKDGLRLMFWSGQSFKTKGLVKEGSFKAAEARYTRLTDVDDTLLAKWLAESRVVQWDYKHIVQRRGKLVRLKAPE